MVCMSELMVWKTSVKSVSSVISCWLRIQHSFCTCVRMSFLMPSSLDSEDRRRFGVRRCMKRRGAGQALWVHSGGGVTGKPDHKFIPWLSEHLLDPRPVSGQLLSTGAIHGYPQLLKAMLDTGRPEWVGETENVPTLRSSQRGGRDRQTNGQSQTSAINALQVPSLT